jgi:outer membrane protein
MDIARLLRVGEEVYIGYAIKHRSGIYGLINDVDKGGSNYNMITLETNF